MNTPPPSPTPPNATPDPNQPDDMAASVIRAKVARLYAEEPDASSEAAEVRDVTKRSKHQQFMYELSASGKDLAAIQTEWHAYYVSLPDVEKHEVWQEFYNSQSSLQQPAVAVPEVHTQRVAEHKHKVVAKRRPAPKAAKPARPRDTRTVEGVQATIRNKVSSGGKLGVKHHVQSLLFGLGMGLLVIIIFLFGFFNEVIIAPFIQPSRVASATPIIVNSSTIAASSTPQVIIPKINVQIPADYSQTSTNEATIENALESGIVHYPTTSVPGQAGNAAFFGHSSNNIFNKGKYKFAFVLLHTLVPGDTFYLTYNGQVYVYKVISKTVVDPSDVGVLDPVPGQTATATLITCDPPGTSLKRLIIVGQQISPDVSGNSAAAPVAATSSQPTTELPGNGPTLFGRFLDSSAGKVVGVVILVAALLWVIRWINKPSRLK